MTGGWPSMRDYLDWAQAQGCNVQLGDTVHHGRFQVVTITAPSGRAVREIVTELDDLLMSTTVARLDRRLGLKSTLFM